MVTFNSTVEITSETALAVPGISSSLPDNQAMEMSNYTLDLYSVKAAARFGTFFYVVRIDEISGALMPVPHDWHGSRVTKVNDKYLTFYATNLPNTDAYLLTSKVGDE